MTKPIIETNYGLASSYDEAIEINWKLTGDLRTKIIEHELRHDNAGYSKQDFKNDFQAKNSYFLESLWWSLKNPEALIGFFPLMFSYYFKVWTFNKAALIPFAWFGLIFAAFFWLTIRANFFLGLGVYALLFIIMNSLLLIIAHVYVGRQKSWFVYKETKDL